MRRFTARTSKNGYYFTHTTRVHEAVAGGAVDGVESLPRVPPSVAGKGAANDAAVGAVHLYACVYIAEVGSAAIFGVN